LLLLIIYLRSSEVQAGRAEAEVEVVLVVPVVQAQLVEVVAEEEDLDIIRITHLQHITLLQYIMQV
jgi:hypothetical protein